MAVSIKIFRLSFCVFLCACPTAIFLILGKSFHFPFPYFVLFVLQYFPFHVVQKIIIFILIIAILADECNRFSIYKCRIFFCNIGIIFIIFGYIDLLIY
jgi:hypothetical protein